MLALTPEQVTSRDGLRLVDVRPGHERDAGLGFVPGSIGIEPSVDVSAFVEAVSRLARSSPVLLVCTSGERARKWALETSGLLAGDLGYLAGGVLGWAAAGLPLCGRDLPSSDAPGLSPPDITRRLVACFVAELADFSLDRDLDPLEILRTVFRRANADFDAPNVDGLRRVVDHAAALSLDWGTPLPRVAANVDAMLALLQSA